MVDKNLSTKQGRGMAGQSVDKNYAPVPGSHAGGEEGKRGQNIFVHRLTTVLTTVAMCHASAWEAALWHLQNFCPPCPRSTN